jgi:hypothetical protein
VDLIHQRQLAQKKFALCSSLENKLEWRRLKTTVRSRLKEMENEYWLGICDDIKKKEKIGDSGGYFEALKRTYGKIK